MNIYYFVLLSHVFDGDNGHLSLLKTTTEGSLVLVQAIICVRSFQV